MILPYPLVQPRGGSVKLLITLLFSLVHAQPAARPVDFTDLAGKTWCIDHSPAAIQDRVEFSADGHFHADFSYASFHQTYEGQWMLADGKLTAINDQGNHLLNEVTIEDDHLTLRDVDNGKSATAKICR
jgi:hypothetical protein